LNVYILFTIKSQEDENIRILYFLLFNLVHVRKRNTLVNGPIVTADYHTKSEITRRKTESDQSNDYFRQQNTVKSPSIDTDEESKLVRPYFLIRPQSVLVLPNESGRLTKIT